MTNFFAGPSIIWENSKAFRQLLTLVQKVKSIVNNLLGTVLCPNLVKLMKFALRKVKNLKKVALYAPL